MPGLSVCLNADRPRKSQSFLRSLALMTSCHRGQEIYGPDQPAEQWYCVISGLARKYALAPGGRRQIVDFLLPGDFFGFTARDRHVFAVEAVLEGTVVARYPRRRLEMIADSDPELARMLRDVAFEAMSRLQARILILGRTTAVEKVGAFLVEMAERLPGGTAEMVALPMSRYDIADYLALSVETVSRALTDLKHSGAITLAKTRRVRINDRAALEEGVDF